MSKRKSYKIPEAQLSLFDTSHPVMPVLDVSRCETRLINHETAARMVETYHYAHRVPGQIYLALGLYIDTILAGVLTYSPTFLNICASICGEQYQNNVLELSRLFIFDWAGRNCESWFIAQSFRFIDLQYFILLSYSDTCQNHVGLVYQATNWLYTGLSNSAIGREYIMPGGKVLARRGWQFRKDNDNRSTLSFDEIEKIHPGIQKVKSSIKHRYVYFLGNKRQRKELRKALKWSVLPYPKNVASIDSNAL